MLSLGLFSQQGTNPFDVRVEDRADRSVPKSNQFDIEDPSRQNEKPSSPIQSIIDFDNPFDVSHIPLRRSQVRVSNSNSSNINVPRVSNSAPKQKSYYLPLIAILLSCIILGFVLVRDRSIVGNILRSINNPNYASGFKQNQMEGRSPSMGFLYLIFIINAALFVYLSASKFFGITNLNYWYLSGAVLLIYFTRHTFLKIFAWLFPVEQAIEPYSFTIQLLNSLIGVILIPLNLMLAYGPGVIFYPIVLLSLFLITLAFLVRYYRGMTLRSKLRTGTLFHFFIYFCTFEILPFWMGYTFLTQLSS